MSERLEDTWLVGKGSYGSRQIPVHYRHLMTPQKEVLQLSELLPSKSLETETMTPAQLTTALRSLRFQYLQKEWADTDRRRMWEEAAHAIDQKLLTIQTRWGVDVTRQIKEGILQLETFLPLAGDDFDNYERYVTDMPHGLLHSLTVLDETFNLSEQLYRGTPDAAKHFEESKSFLIGTALYHDITGLRQRKAHHETARDLARLILPAIHKENGQRFYSNELVEQIALGCYRHRGQEFPSPQAELEKLFVDADEYILVLDVQRILDQPFNGVFQPELLDVYRRYMIQGKRKATPGTRFEHETRSADLFQFLLFTLIDRTNPDNYYTRPAKRLVQAKYIDLKSQITRFLDIETRREVRTRNGSLIEIPLIINRMKGIVLELEALERRDPAARESLRRQIGDQNELVSRIRELKKEFNGIEMDDFTDATFQHAFGYLESADQLRSGKGATIPKKSEQKSDLFRNRYFKVGRDLIERYLENPGISMQDEFDRAATTTADTFFASASDVMPWILAGFAYQLSRVVTDRLVDLFLMVRSPQLGQRMPHRLEGEFAFSTAGWFLKALDRGETPNTALSFIRQRLDRLRNKRDRVVLSDDLKILCLRMIDKVRKAPTLNMHLHTSGVLTAERIAQIYRAHPDLVPIFQAKTETSIDPRRVDELRTLFFPERRVGSNNQFELPFVAGHVILNNDPTGELTREWYRQCLLQSAEEGNRLISVVSTFDQETATPEQFRKSVQAAIEGLNEGERETDGKTRGVLLFGLRKTIPLERSQEMLKEWIALKDVYPDKIFGIDSVGFEIDERFNLDHQLLLLKSARESGLWVKYHVGESWKKGELYDALLRIQKVIRTGDVDQITNSIALVVNADTLPADYPFRSDIKILQHSLIHELRERQIYVELSPTSNEIMAREMRVAEGWQFSSLSIGLQAGLLVLITDDDPGPFDTSFIDDHLRLLLGVTPYGIITEKELDLLLQYNETVLRKLWNRNGFPKSNYRPLPAMPPGLRSAA